MTHSSPHRRSRPIEQQQGGTAAPGRRRFLQFGAAAVVAASTGWTATRAATPARAATPPAPSTDVHFFYYPWYGTPAFNGSWRHWPQGDHQPPNEISSNFYPALGPYDSGDLSGAVAQHMAWVRQAGVGVIVTSWWGQGSYEDQRVSGLLSVAAQYGVKVAWHLEPYTGRTAASTVSDIRYINSRYGSSPAFHRDAKHGNRPVFYIFDSLDIADWSALDQVNGDNLILTQTTDCSKVTHFGGMYNYAVGTDFTGWKGIADWCRANGKVWAPSVGPGYIDDRAVPGNTTPTLTRADGATYDLIWSSALAPENGGPPTWVSITSFNEWHEGTMIEPATGTPPAGVGYQTYEGAYGRTGAAATTAYLDRTLYWVNRFTGGGTPTAPPTTPPANPDLALHRNATAGSTTQNYGPGNAVDGNADTYWESANNAFPQWWQVDLGAAQQVSRLVLRLPPATAWGTRTQTVAVQAGSDGSNWTTVKAAAGYTFNPAGGNTVTVALPPTTARYLRLVFTGNTGWPAGQLSQFEAYAT
ncbi:discoidin domain-containing protein [Streptomyces sp. NPDC092296]|uniref:galactose-binding domain-containing protein n=1 Tax=Streptomyces sp. NPDC092296 TaxID=3366012 RepID=UPI00382A67B9